LAALEKIYPCLSCQQEIRLERKDGKWLRWNLDGTPHVDQKKQQQQQKTSTQQTQPTITTSASTAATPTRVSLESKIDQLIAEVQALRLELQQQKGRK
jgi:hypothetical protein